MPRTLPQSRVTRIIPSYRGTHPADLAARRLAEVSIISLSHTAGRVFSCDASYIDQVPTHVLQHVELNKLLLDNNKLSCLPEDIKLMTSLEVHGFLFLNCVEYT
jgi:hypothetical protein